jgi:hypothetical protein
MKFKILSYYKSVTTKEKYGFLGLKTNYNTVITIIKDSDPEFADIDSYYKSKVINAYSQDFPYRIYSVLRLYDNKVLTIDDVLTIDVDVVGFKYSYDTSTYIEKIGGFCLDGYDYCGFILKSKSGIQIAIGGGTFLDINDYNKTPLKELRKIKLERLKRTCNGGVS